MRASPAVEQQCGYVPSTPNQLARAHSAQRPGVAVTRPLIASTNKMLHPNRPALIPGCIPPTCTRATRRDDGGCSEYAEIERPAQRKASGDWTRWQRGAVQ